MTKANDRQASNETSNASGSNAGMQSAEAAAPGRTLEQLRAERAQRKAEARRAFEEQRLIDETKRDKLEVELGDTSIATLNVPHTPGMPTLAVVRLPTKPEVKRFRDSVRPRKNHEPDQAAAAEQVGRCCTIYPTGDALAELLDKRPGLLVQLGTAALELATGKEEAEGKD